MCVRVCEPVFLFNLEFSQMEMKSQKKKKRTKNNCTICFAPPIVMIISFRFFFLFECGGESVSFCFFLSSYLSINKCIITSLQTMNKSVFYEIVR
jgi:hypothetical protein